MKYFFILIFISFTSQAKVISSDLKLPRVNREALEEDLRLILKKSSLSKMSFNIKIAKNNKVEILCRENEVFLSISSQQVEVASTFYFALHSLGFLFPHPRWTIYPKKEDILKKCNKTFEFNPTLKYRGFHLHTLHPNEWVYGFLMGKEDIAFDYIRWLARNFQNVFDLSLLDMPDTEIVQHLEKPFSFAKKLGIATGITVGLSLSQQNSYKLLNLFQSITTLFSNQRISKKMNFLSDKIDFSYVNLEIGTSEFTPTNYSKTIEWMNQISNILEKKDKKLFVKVHVSSNQYDEGYGNFNFLPSFTNKKVGVLPHTVMFYELNDDYAPMYGNKNFSLIKSYLINESHKRPVWYYPETSYFIFMDIDHPLLLTDYLVARANDTKFLYENNIEGQLVFTTGHELGYWLMDWNNALLTNLDYKFDPLIGIKLLGENQNTWQKIVNFQHKYFKKKQLIQDITSANFQDEFSKNHRIHKRTLLKEYAANKIWLKHSLNLFQEANSQIPKLSEIKNKELKLLLEITFLRLQHAYHLRLAIAENSILSERKKITDLRKKAQAHIKVLIKNYERYPDAFIFSENKNPTAYQFGYGFTASTLYLWRREEGQIFEKNWSPFYMNLYNIFDIVF